MTSVLSGCRLEISSLLRSKTNETVAAQNHACDFYPELVPGDSYTFRGWTLSGQDEIISQELRVTKLVAPVYDEEKFEVKLVPDVTSVRVTWGSAVTKYWGPLVGSKGNFSARLRNEDGVESRDDVQMASPVGADAATSLSFNGLTYGTCYSLEIYTTTAGEVSNRSPKYFRTGITPRIFK